MIKFGKIYFWLMILLNVAVVLSMFGMNVITYLAQGYYALPSFFELWSCATFISLILGVRASVYEKPSLTNSHVILFILINGIVRLIFQLYGFSESTIQKNMNYVYYLTAFVHLPSSYYIFQYWRKLVNRHTVEECK
ncbi:hypothetical protein [Photobacterium sp. Hal280]|uniref:hypothetical protein n=1 Tax=Photobacterium sp. Hal280 TaxID=3035163 RepID=UPI00301C2C63